MSKTKSPVVTQSRDALPALLLQVKAARRAAVPILAITTPDPAATITAITDTINGEVPHVVWDVVDGVKALNEQGREVLPKMIGEIDPTVGNPVMLLQLIRKLPDKSLIFMHLANRWLGDPSVVQAAWNLRDVFKRDGRTLVMLAPSIELPAELAGDVVVLDEPLPDPKALAAIAVGQHEEAHLNVDEEVIAKAVEAVQGLPSFQAEQVVAMSLTKAGLDIPNLWERKRRQIELTPGLKVHREGVTFADIGGVPVIKDFLGKILRGNAKPSAIIFLDEIEKHLAGAAGGGKDSSGVSQDQLGAILQYMQDQNAAGCIFIGPPGASKSMVAKAAGNEAGIPTIQLDLGGMKGSLVGQSEQSLRQALKVITSVSNGRSLWIATCNAIADLPPELRRRFTLGTFFFDLPSKEERDVIWKIYGEKYALPDRAYGAEINDDGWTGAEIKQACDIAWRLGCPVADAAKFVVPVSRSAGEQLERLRKAAEGKFLSASKPGVYVHPDNAKRTEIAGNGRSRRLATVGED